MRAPTLKSDLKRRSRWIFIPMTMWIVTEVIVGRFFAHNLRWYEAADAELGTSPPVQAVFIGSSRVNAAIDSVEAGKEASRRLGRPYRVLNLGYGDTNLAEHYLGLRYLWERHPDKLRGITLFVEAAGGAPESRSWNDPWLNGNLSASLPYLNATDLPRVWQGKDTFENKVEATLRLATRFSNILSRKDKVQQYAFMVNDSLVAPRLIARPNGNRVPTADLSDEGGIRSDSEGVKQARRLAVEVSRRQAADQPIVENWDNRVVSSIVRLATQHGAKVVFFEVPMSSVMMSPYETKRSLANADAFRIAAKTWNCQIIRNTFATTDEDFPDLWHMRKSLSATYTKALVDAGIGLGVR